jgi:hypothetical protein
VGQAPTRRNWAQLLTKPFSYAEFAAKVRDVLGGI